MKNKKIVILNFVTLLFFTFVNLLMSFGYQHGDPLKVFLENEFLVLVFYVIAIVMFARNNRFATYPGLFVIFITTVNLIAAVYQLILKPLSSLFFAGIVLGSILCLAFNFKYVLEVFKYRSNYEQKNNIWKAKNDYCEQT